VLAHWSWLSFSFSFASRSHFETVWLSLIDVITLSNWIGFVNTKRVESRGVRTAGEGRMSSTRTNSGWWERGMRMGNGYRVPGTRTRDSDGTPAIPIDPINNFKVEISSWILWPAPNTQSHTFLTLCTQLSSISKMNLKVLPLLLLSLCRCVWLGYGGDRRD